MFGSYNQSGILLFELPVKIKCFICRKRLLLDSFDLLDDFSLLFHRVQGQRLKIELLEHSSSNHRSIRDRNSGETRSALMYEMVPDTWWWGRARLSLLIRHHVPTRCVLSSSGKREPATTRLPRDLSNSTPPSRHNHAYSPAKPIHILPLLSPEELKITTILQKHPPALLHGLLRA